MIGNVSLLFTAISIEKQVRHIADHPHHTKNVVCVLVSQKCLMLSLPRNLHLIHTPQVIAAPPQSAKK